jgi:NADH dehydrogenase
MPDDRRPHVVILGAGFGGLHAARALEKAKVRITVIDRRNHHLFQPLLYQVATAALNASDIAAPIRHLLRKQATVLLADVVGVDVEGKRVLLRDGAVSYDYLIVATGATHSYFGNDAWAAHAPGLKTLEDALDIRRRVLLAYEAAEREEHPECRKELLSFVIVGAGPTGVEMAGALAEISRQALAKDFTHIDPTSARVVLLEGVDRVLPPYPENLSAAARRSLERLGVEVRTGVRVTQVDESGVELADGSRIKARTVIWAAGVAGSPVARSLGAPLDKAGRVQVTPHLTVPGRPEVFVVGDLAAVMDEDGQPVPGVAPAAMQMGAAAARNVKHAIAGEPLFPFEYWDRGTFSVIGRGAAVGVAFRRFKMTGALAWLTWLFVHVLFLVGFRSRLVVLVNWAYSYIGFRRAARIITGDPPDLSQGACHQVAVNPARPGDGEDSAHLVQH